MPEIKLQKRIIYSGEVFASLMGRGWGCTEASNFLREFRDADAVEVVHGRWIHPKGYVVSNAFFCSVCNHEEVSLHVIHPLHGGGCKADEHGNFYYPPKMNYCPNCGAKMDGGADRDGNT